jgi:hypothetical protein
VNNKPKEMKKHEAEGEKPQIRDISSMKLDDIKIQGTNNPILRRTLPSTNEVDYDDDDDEDRLDRRVGMNHNGTITIDIASNHFSSEKIEVPVRPSVYRKLSSTVILPYDEENNFSSFILRDTWKSEERGASSRRQTNVKINFSSLRRAVVNSISSRTDVRSDLTRKSMAVNQSTQKSGASVGIADSISVNSPIALTLTPYPPVTSRLSPSAIELLGSRRFAFS